VIVRAVRLCNAILAGRHVACYQEHGHPGDHLGQDGPVSVVWPNHQEDTVQFCGFVTSGCPSTGCRKLAGHSGAHDLSDPPSAGTQLMANLKVKS
jgi:hypothetical protein